MGDLVHAPATMLEQTVTVLTNAATDPRVDVVKMQALLDMQRQLLEMQAAQEFHEAIASLPPIRVAKNGTIDLGPDKNGKPRHITFAEWSDMDLVLRPMLMERGLFLTFTAEERASGGLTIIGTLRHRNRQCLSASMPLALDIGPGRNNLQAGGSTLSYGKRYTTDMLVNIVRIGEDDDGKLGGTVFITDTDVARIEALLSETNSSRDQFMGWAGVSDLATIEAKNLPQIMNALLAKREKMK